MAENMKVAHNKTNKINHKYLQIFFIFTSFFLDMLGSIYSFDNLLIQENGLYAPYPFQSHKLSSQHNFF